MHGGGVDEGGGEVRRGWGCLELNLLCAKSNFFYELSSLLEHHRVEVNYLYESTT